jgi:hypothetical protein
VIRRRQPRRPAQADAGSSGVIDHPADADRRPASLAPLSSSGLPTSLVRCHGPGGPVTGSPCPTYVTYHVNGKRMDVICHVIADGKAVGVPDCMGWLPRAPGDRDLRGRPSWREAGAGASQSSAGTALPRDLADSPVISSTGVCADGFRLAAAWHAVTSRRRRRCRRLSRRRGEAQRDRASSALRRVPVDRRRERALFDDVGVHAFQCLAERPHETLRQPFEE